MFGWLASVALAVSVSAHNGTLLSGTFVFGILFYFQPAITWESLLAGFILLSARSSFLEKWLAFFVLWGQPTSKDLQYWAPNGLDLEEPVDFAKVLD